MYRKSSKSFSIDSLDWHKEDSLSFAVLSHDRGNKLLHSGETSRCHMHRINTRWYLRKAVSCLSFDLSIRYWACGEIFVGRTRTKLNMRRPIWWVSQRKLQYERALLYRNYSPSMFRIWVLAFWISLPGNMRCSYDLVLRIGWEFYHIYLVEYT